MMVLLSSSIALSLLTQLVIVCDMALSSDKNALQSLAIICVQIDQ